MGYSFVQLITRGHHIVLYTIPHFGTNPSHLVGFGQTPIPWCSNSQSWTLKSQMLVKQCHKPLICWCFIPMYGKFWDSLLLPFQHKFLFLKFGSFSAGTSYPRVFITSFFSNATISCAYVYDWHKTNHDWDVMGKCKDNIMGHMKICTNIYIYIHTYITLHYITLHCIALHCVALHCIALHCIALRCIALHCIALHYITWHYITYIP